MDRLREWFMAPARQAAAWAFLAVAGIALGAAGLVFLLTGDESDRAFVSSPPEPTGTSVPSLQSRTPTPEGPGSTRTAPTASPTVNVRPTPRPPGTTVPSPESSSTPAASPSPATVSPTATTTVPTPRPTSPPPPPTATSTATSTPTPTPTPVLLSYCEGSASTPPYILAGLLEIGGGPAPSGTFVSIQFDGAPGPSGEITQGEGESGYKIRFAADTAEDCANHPGAPIAVVVNGTVVPTPFTIETGNAFLVHNVSIP